jgi:RHS repeat-associated protein
MKEERLIGKIFGIALACLVVGSMLATAFPFVDQAAASPAITYLFDDYPTQEAMDALSLSDILILSNDNDLPIEFGETISSSIGASGEEDEYTFSADANDTIIIRLDSTSGYLGPEVRLYATNGTLLNSQYSSDHLEMQQTLPDSGEYQILVCDYYINYTGNYTIFLQRLNNPSGTTPIAFGETISDSIDPAPEADIYTFSAGANDTVIIRLDKTSGPYLAPEIRLYAPNGTMLKSQYSSDHLEMQYTLADSGEYQILVCDYYINYTGNYTIFLQRLNNPSGTTPIAFGETISDSIDPAPEADIYTFSAGANDTVIIRLDKTSGPYLAPEIRLYATNGTLLNSQYSSDHLEMQQTLPDSGEYRILVCDHNIEYTGSYSLSLDTITGGGLVSWWRGEGDANDSWDDNNGVLMNGATFGMGRIGQAFQLDGLDDWVMIPSTPSLNFGTGDFTVSLWVNFTDPYPEQMLIEKFVEAGSMPGRAGWTFVKLTGSTIRFAGPLGGNAAILDAPASITANTWHFAAVCRAGSTYWIYWDGTLIGSTTRSDNLNFDSDVSLKISHRGNPDDTPGSHDWRNFYLKGLVDEVQIHNFALSAADILSMFNNPGVPPGPAAYIDSPANSGTILAGDSLRFSGHGVVSPEYGPPSYVWDFGDGRSSTLKDPGLLSFTIPGTNVVTLDVTDTQGTHAANNATRTITVEPETGLVPDLAVTLLNVPANLSIGIPTDISYTVRNAGDSAVSGQSWADALYLSNDTYLDATDRLLKSVSVSETIDPGTSYSNSVSLTLPTLEEGAYYLILSVDNQWQILERHQLNNELAASIDVVIPELTNGIAVPGEFVVSGDARYYRIDVPAGQNLFVRLDDADNQGANELYLRRGSLPTRGLYDHRSTALGSADQQLLVPAVIPGTWYILAYTQSVSDGDFTIRADFSSGPKVTGVTPTQHGASATTVLTVNGAGFDGMIWVALVDGDGITHPATAISVDSYTQITATFDLTALAAGIYTVRASSPSGTGDLSNAFEVLPGGEAKLETNLIVPSWMGQHAVATLYIEYSNTGNIAMPAPLLVVTATQEGREGAFFTLKATRLVDGFWTSAEPEGFSHTIQILASGSTAGMLQPGESFRVPVYYAGWQQPWDWGHPFIFELGVLTADNTAPVDWSSLKDGMKPASITAEAWEALWASFASQVGTTWGDYVRMLDDNAAYLGRMGQRVVDVGQLLSFEFLQADGLSPLRTLAGAVDAAVEVPGLPLVFSHTFAEPISARYELGPVGRSWSHNWQYSLAQADDGTVTVVGPGGSRRIFQPDSRYSGSYFSQPGDYATLTALGGGAFTLREPDGLLLVFKADGKLDYVEDTNSNRITCSYTGDLLTSLTHSSGQSVIIAYNAAGRIQSVTDSVGRQTTFTYDAADEHLLMVQDYDEQITSYSYISGQGAAREHALTEISYPGGTHRYFSYDAQGRLSGTSRDGNAEEVTFAYEAGKVTTTDALGDSSKFYFDHRGLLVKTEDALGNAVYMSFDDYYNLTALTDPAGRSYTYGYDSRGNLVRSTDPLGYVTRFGYAGAFNRLTTVTDAKNNVTSYGYDINGNLYSITYADGSIESWGYDSLGDPTSWTNRRGNVIGYTYDAAGRITSKTYADGSHMEYVYDSRGNLVSTTDPAGITIFSYDANDYLTRIDYPGGQWLQYTYDDAGRRTSSLDQTGHQLDYHYDALGRLENLTNESSIEVVHYNYDAAGRISRKTLGNGVYTTYEYDAAGQLLHVVNYNADGSVLSRFDYTYDSRGRRLSMNTSYGLWTYEYDDLGQLTHAVLAPTDPSIPNQDLAYVYDGLGNRICTIENGVTTEYTPNNMNQYTQVGDTTYVFDADGNLIEEQSPSGTTSYTYNDENSLNSVTKGTDTWLYVYDALGNRVATIENGVTTNYVIDPIGLGNVVGEYDASRDLVARYDHGFGLLTRIDATGNAACYTFDAIGNSQQMTNFAGAIANSYVYMPFGMLIQEAETIPNRFKFIGEFGVFDEASDICYMNERFYDEETGRFLSEDPIRLSAGSINLVAYVQNDPVSRIDPLGLAGSHKTICEGFGYIIKKGVNARGPSGPHLQIARIGEKSFLHIFKYKIHFRIGQQGFGVYFKTVGKMFTIGLGVILDILLNPSDTIVTGEEELEAIRAWDWEHDVPSLVPPTTATDSSQKVPSGPSDPNAKMGPSGFGEEGSVLPDETFAYRIDFENEPSATAPAQQAVITDQLDSELDWATLQFTEIGFGDQFILVPSDTQHFETVVPVTYSGVDFEVNIVVDLELTSGRVTAHFYSIDPETGLPPTVDIGFLPPEDGTGRGMGHISYIIEPKPGLSTGTEIRNIALISFDYQPEIATNQVDPHDPSQGTDPTKECPNTIDAGSPTSQVNELPSEINTVSFPVTWTGSDDSGGSGISSYDIYVSDNSGPFNPWLNDTTNLSSEFIGSVGHTYSFYSIATDNVGNIEDAPLEPDAATTVEVVSTKTVGETREVNCAILPGVAITLYQDDVEIDSTVSNGTGNYELAVPEFGDYDVTVSNDGFRDETRAISVTNSTTYTLDFVGESGLIPDAPNMSYVLACINLWKFGEPPCNLNMSTVLAVINAWKFPI